MPVFGVNKGFFKIKYTLNIRHIHVHALWLK